MTHAPGPAASAPDQPLSVATLIGTRHVAMAATCLGTITQRLQGPIRLHVFDDGTLSDADLETLRQSLGPFEHVSRAQCDDLVQPRIKAYDWLNQYRSLGPLAIKLIDVPFVLDGPFGFIDSDIMATRRFAGFDRSFMQHTPAVFMQEEDDSFCLPLKRRIGSSKPMGLSLARGFNSGFFLLDPDRAYDPDLLNRFAEYCLSRGYPHWLLEQTAYGVLHGRASGQMFDRQQVTTPPLPRPDRKPPVILHFLNCYRYLLEDKAYLEAMTTGNDNPDPEMLRSVEPIYDGALTTVSRAVGKQFVRRLRHPGSPPRSTSWLRKHRSYTAAPSRADSA